MIYLLLRLWPRIFGRVFWAVNSILRLKFQNSEVFRFFVFLTVCACRSGKWIRTIQSTADGNWALRGKRTVDPCGKWRGPIRSSVKFLLHALSIGRPPFGKKLVKFVGKKKFLVKKMAKSCYITIIMGKYSDCFSKWAEYLFSNWSETLGQTDDSGRL